MEKIAMYREAIYKKASEEQEKKESKLKKATKSAILGTSGTGLLYSSKDRLLGQKTLYHGTSDSAWENIKNEGIRTDRGGKGGASRGLGTSESYKNDNKGYVYATGYKSKADDYRHRAIYNEIIDEQWEDNHKNVKKGKPYKHIDFGQVEHDVYKGKHKNKGKTAKIKMDYNKYKDHFDIAPKEAGRVYIGKGKLKENYGKHLAARGNVDITPDEIVGLHKTSKRLKNRAKQLPAYIKRNKARFGTGVALAGTGGILISNALKDK